MKTMIRQYIGLTVCALLADSAAMQAQITFDGCRDVRGIPVASVLDTSIGDVAMASLAPDGTPIIRYNPYVLSWFSRETRLWWYGHECGHHALGHNFGTAHPLAAEQQADCYGIRSLLEAGVLSRGDLRIIQEELSRTGPGDWTHLPGPVRAVNLSRCLDSPGGGGGGTRRRPCQHPLHPMGDVSPCRHALHPYGDVYPCQHACPTYWGPAPCHPAGDVFPCSHPAHPAGDVSQCVHPSHPQGDVY